ncbi:hypothetical protein J0X19_10560 [Hymenobacter sp. BT186]|uniref:Uncharacterized protein n=1 Tax=Hymenobacter telluris TaxID=2816474 RepID=A0A939EXF8_9BACT|nr:hypothetical protein [Hymenobacter telluris]MBO0358387.1 hypothetical protein [Hymenobacter telluris]MBW3374413.1 hypothetical protein [Hymenobacter norwichensis]
MRHFLILCSLLLLTAQAYAQDVILYTNGEERPGKVLGITPDSVTYLTTEAGRSDTVRLATSSVFLIRYANGTKELLTKPATAPTEQPMSKEEAYAQGRLDARKYYRAPGAFWGTYSATVLTGYGGPIVGVAVAASKPRPRNFVVPDAKRLQDPNYTAGYQRQAQRKKIGSAAGGFGAGVGTLAVVAAVMVAILVNTTHW